MSDERPSAPAARDACGRGGLCDGAYLIREAMRRALGSAAAELARSGFAAREVLILDVGGRGHPYADLFARAFAATGHAVRHVVIDPGEAADVTALAEALPVASGCADLVLCTQVLEHVEEPARAVAEMARALKPGGVCLLTTHGTWFYHPDPGDYWRWTPEGLRRLFVRAGYAQVNVEPVGGTKLAIATLALAALERAAGEGIRAGLLRRVVVAPANRVASFRLLRRVTGRACLPGELAINYLVTARRPGPGR